MKHITLITTLFALLICNAALAQKTIYIPQELQENDFNNPESKWSYSRMAETPNVVCFWEKGFGADLAKAPDLEGNKMTVDLPNLLSRLEYFYQVYRDMMRFTLPDSKAERYKMMVMLNYSLEGTAYGGCYDDSIGALWIAPNRVQDRRLNCIAHELGHSFQIQISCDGHGHGIGGGFFEMASQWMLWNVNPEWPTDENYHWKAFIDKANLQFLDIENIYHSPYVLEYWSMKRGIDFIGELIRQCQRREDAAQAYMRLFDLSNSQMARELVDCYSRLITFDFPSKHEMNKRYAGEFLNDKALHTFGANVQDLTPSLSNREGGTDASPLLGRGRGRLVVNFSGEKSEGYAYRLVAVNDKAEATYGDIVIGHQGKATISLPSDAQHVYLVVTGYPLGKYKPNDKKTYPYQWTL